MLESALKFSFRRSALAVCVLLISGCANRSVSLVHPQSGATSECSGSGFGLASAWLQSYIDDCIRRSESRGYVAVEKLTSEQRLDLERRGLLPKNAGALAPHP